jgi:DNA invertase Pin-like site-specific DNA recombinase
MELKAALYARVSTVDKDQNPDVQLAKLRQYCDDMGWTIYREYIDYASAADMVHRQAWADLLKRASVRRFNVLLVWKIDRAFRSVIHAANTLGMLRGYGVGFRSYSESSIDTTTPHGEFIFNILAAVSQLERQTISQRVQSGMDYVRQHGTKSGVPIGRARLKVSTEDILQVLGACKGSYSAAARELTRQTGIDISPGVIWQRVKRNGGKPLQNLAPKIGGKQIPARSRKR